MQDLVSLIGRELPLSQVSTNLYFWFKEQLAPVCGAVQVCCADESEKECTVEFSKHFAEPLLPNLKFGQGSQFRLANLGGRYEWGSVPIAESHFAIEASRDSFKVIVVKINSHVAFYRARDGIRYGRKPRYGHESAYCGALDALLSGSVLPGIKSLDETFSMEGKDRLGALRDPEQVEPRYRMLLAAVVQARLQARRAVLDIQNLTQRTPTLFLVVPCVTFNRESEDTELVCGFYHADLRSDTAEVRYQGLGDDPAAYEVKEEHRPVRIVDDQMDAVRLARDHRKLVLQEWIEQKKMKPPRPEEKEAVATIVAAERTRAPHGKYYSRTLLRSLLDVVAGLNPVTAVVQLFAEGLIGIHHAARMHRLARGVHDDEAARKILDEFRTMIDSLPPDRAQAVTNLLLAEYGQR